MIKVDAPPLYRPAPRSEHTLARKEKSVFCYARIMNPIYAGIDPSNISK